jgi:hypothetical protein
MINRVGQRLLQAFEGASAAYSLRDLASNIASVVRVRRASDNSEKDFSASDVSSGAMTSWVNAQVVPPLDVRELVDGERTGDLVEAAAAYSLRNLSASYTGDVVQVRRSSDDAEESFTAAEVADGTLEDWVNEDLDITNRLIVPSDIATRFVVTSSTDASNYNASIDNDSASTDFVEMRSGLFREGRYRLTGTLEVSNLVGNLLIQTNGGVASGTQNVGLSNGTNNLDFEFDITGDGSSTSAGSTLLYFLIPSGTSATLGLSNLTWEVTQADGHVKTWYDQTESRTDDPQNITGFLVEHSNDIMNGEWDKVADVNGKVAFTHEDDVNRTLNWTGTRWEFKDSSTVYYYSTVDTTYPFDVSNEWVAVEGSGTPDFESFDGGWYDPLGRGGMLTMHAALFQPTIVRNGVYLGEIDFDESNDKLNAHFELDIDPADSGFASIVVARVDSTDTTGKQVLLQNSSSGSRHLIQWQPNGRYQFYARDAEGDTKTFITNDSFGNDEYKVFTTTIDSDSLCRANVNGFGEVNHIMNASVDFSSVDSTANSDEVISPSGNPFMGAVKEMIFYLSDQSDSRTAIEANIGETYGIDLPSGVDTGYDQVDGFVETWYDQSSSAVTNYDLYPTIASGSFSSTGVTFQKLPLGNADERTFTLVANNSTATRYVSFVTGSNGIRTGKHRIAFDLTLNSGSIGTITGYHTDRDADPSNGGSYAPYVVTEGSNVIDFEIFNDGVGASPEIIWAINTGSTFDISVTNFEVSHVTETIVRNGNDATQLTAGNQPKIVDAGSLLVDSAGLPEIDFDGTSHKLDIDLGSNLSQPNSILMVHQSDSVLEADNEFFDRTGVSGQRTLFDTTDDGSGDRRYRMLAQSSLTTINAQLTTSKNLVVGVYDGTNSSLSLNGNTSNFTNTVGADSINSLSTIGFSIGSGNYYDGTMQEFIIYNTDQSANREAIETNINNQYDIY